jgi:hypothetical protein
MNAGGIDGGVQQYRPCGSFGALRWRVVKIAEDELQLLDLAVELLRRRSDACPPQRRKLRFEAPDLNLN